MNLKEHLEKQTYDKWYQDIECLGFEGYAKSSKSWENIKDLIDWKDKSIIDIGSFHGYFCLKAEQAGAKFVIGIDKNESTVKTASMIAIESKTKVCDYFVNTANEWVNTHAQQFDLILCLNVFHHIPNKDGFLKSLQSGQLMIMEIDKENEPKIEEYCNILVRKLSHRPSAYTGDTPNRLVLLVEKA